MAKFYSQPYLVPMLYSLTAALFDEGKCPGAGPQQSQQQLIESAT